MCTFTVREEKSGGEICRGWRVSQTVLADDEHGFCELISLMIGDEVG